MKRIGLIGGLSPESTVHYYQLLCRSYNQLAGGWNFPALTLESLNLQDLLPLFERNAWDQVAAILLEALKRLEGAEAEFAAILANTPHNAYDQIRDASPLPIVTIMDATSSALVRDGLRKVALLGTRATMEFGFFQRHFASRGIETIVPEPADRTELDRIIWDELTRGVVRDESRQAVQAMMHQLVGEGAEGMILGCTELTLLVRPPDSPRRLYDTTEIHAEAILQYALG